MRDAMRTGARRAWVVAVMPAVLLLWALEMIVLPTLADAGANVRRACRELARAVSETWRGCAERDGEP